MKSGLVPHDLSAVGTRGYLMYGSVQEPETLIEDVRMLPAGHYLRWKNGKAKLTKYWEIEFRNADCELRSCLRGKSSSPSLTFSPPGERQGPEAGMVFRVGGIRNSKFEMTRAEAIRIVRDALEESIERHFVSDVPVGVFLSGGIDSTSIVALASQKDERTIADI